MKPVSFHTFRPKPVDNAFIDPAERARDMKSRRTRLRNRTHAGQVTEVNYEGGAYGALTGMVAGAVAGGAIGGDITAGQQEREIARAHKRLKTLFHQTPRGKTPYVRKPPELHLLTDREALRKWANNRANINNRVHWRPKGRVGKFVKRKLTKNDRMARLHRRIVMGQSKHFYPRQRKILGYKWKTKPSNAAYMAPATRKGNPAILVSPGIHPAVTAHEIGHYLIDKKAGHTAHKAYMATRSTPELTYQNEKNAWDRGRVPKTLPIRRHALRTYKPHDPKREARDRVRGQLVGGAIGAGVGALSLGAFGAFAEETRMYREDLIEQILEVFGGKARLKRGTRYASPPMPDDPAYRAQLAKVTQRGRAKKLTVLDRFSRILDKVKGDS